MHVVRVVLAAVAVLALSATVAFGDREDAPPAAASFGLETATSASGHDVPVRANEAPAGPLETDEEAPVTEVDEESVDADEELVSEVEVLQEGESHCIDPAAEVEPTVDGEEPNHGAIVCGAARFGDWEAAGCDNHGQYVRSFAHKNHDGEPGECEPAEPVDAAAPETLEVGEETTTTNSNGRGGGQRNGGGRGDGAGGGNGRP